jgi:hypothetical protein
MEYGQTARGEPRQPGPATLNEVLRAELSALRPSLVSSAPATIADSAAERTENLRAIYATIASLTPGDGKDGTVAQPLSALCLSGGGIRGATFNLGVIQGLAKIGLLGKFDYLSSVSGGGHIASWLRNWMHRDGVSAVLDALRPAENIDPLAPEPTPLVNLRESSNFLTPKMGLFNGDTWATAAINARNILLNWLVLIPVLAAIVGIALLFRLIVRGTGIPESWHWQLLSAAVCIELLTSLSVYSFRRFAKRAGTPQAYFIFCCVLPICLSAGVLCMAALGLDLPWGTSAPAPCCSDITGLWNFSFVWYLGVPFISWLVAEILTRLFPRWTLPAPTAAPAQARQAAWMYELMALMISGLVGMGLLVLVVRYCFFFLFSHPDAYVILALPLLLGIYLIGRVLFVGIASLSDTSSAKHARGSSDDADRAWWARLSGWVLMVIVIWVSVTAVCLAGTSLPDLFYEYPQLGDISNMKALVAAFGTVSGLVTALVGGSAKTPANTDSRKPLSIVLLVGVAGAVFIVCMVILLSLGMRLLGEWVTEEPDLFTASQPWAVWLNFAGLLLILCLIALVASRFVNVNRFSLHGVYRDRLVRAYLGASNGGTGAMREVDPFTGFALNDDVSLHRLASGEVRPLPIINTTLNLVQGKNLAWQQRKARSFSMTPLFCGNWSEGYRSSIAYGGPGGITVGTAMTISGAAVNPNVGYNSSPVLAFIMGLFNVGFFNMRMGAWLGNTNSRGNRTYWRSGPKFALLPLFAEVFGLTNSGRRYIKLSDGGHFDNLGLYEVVLRRCRHVLVSDAGNDFSLSYGDLRNTIRRIRIDFGIPIEITNKILIRPSGATQPGVHCAIATIRYSAVGPGSDGLLIYIKPRLRGRVPAKNSDGVPDDDYSNSDSSGISPRETTVDQRFSESQFESHRELGSCILGQLGVGLTNASFQEFLATAVRRIEKRG